MIKRFFAKIKRIFYLKIQKHSLNELALQNAKVSYGKNLSINGLIHINNMGGEIVIGDDVVINSGTEFNPAAGEGASWITVKRNAKLIIGDHVGLSNVSITSWDYIEIGENAAIGTNVVITDSDFHSLDEYERLDPDLNEKNTKSFPVIIKKGAFVGMRSIILKGVTIGEGSVIGAGSVVTKSVPSKQVWAGNPAKYIRDL